MKKERIIYLDVLRVIACFMVVLTHAGDSYILQTESSSIYLALIRPCVPLFILLSGILLLPVNLEYGSFIKRRFTRVLIPFLVWSILYVFMPVPSKLMFGGPENFLTGSDMNIYLYNIMLIPINFTKSNAHFWFIYTILGLYLFLPIISPWIKTASKSTLIVFLSLWTFTLFLPYIKLYFPEFQGECDWNEFGMFHYFSGYLGFIILGYFLHHYNKLSLLASMTIGTILFIVGFVITYYGFLADINKFNTLKEISGVENWKLLELFIGYNTINVALMTAGIFMFFQKIDYSKFVTNCFTELSIFSYGIFLVHYILVLWLGKAIAHQTSLCPVFEQMLLTVVTFVLSYLIVKTISYVPKSKYLIG
ncbi:acyltransferase family protein [Lentisphaerota bacterium WC36G]|nr:acyltransferase family protein [Lentisphaerae bacterium WC36]